MKKDRKCVQSIAAVNTVHVNSVHESEKRPTFLAFRNFYTFLQEKKQRVLYFFLYSEKQTPLLYFYEFQYYDNLLLNSLLVKIRCWMFVFWTFGHTLNDYCVIALICNGLLSSLYLIYFIFFLFYIISVSRRLYAVVRKGCQLIYMQCKCRLSAGQV